MKQISGRRYETRSLKVIIPTMVLSSTTGKCLIFFLDARFTFRIFVRGLPDKTFTQAVHAYREVLEQDNSRLISEKKDPDRCRVTFIIRSAEVDAGKTLEKTFESTVDPALQGSVDWEIG